MKEAPRGGEGGAAFRGQKSNWLAGWLVSPHPHINRWEKPSRKGGGADGGGCGGRGDRSACLAEQLREHPEHEARHRARPPRAPTATAILRSMAGILAPPLQLLLNLLGVNFRATLNGGCRSDASRGVEK